MTALVGLEADETELGAVAVGSGRVGVDGGLEETFHRSVPRLMAIGHSASLQEQLQDLKRKTIKVPVTHCGKGRKYVKRF